MGAICVRCGGRATEGSARYPFCKGCFAAEFGNDTKRYERALDGHWRSHVMGIG